MSETLRAGRAQAVVDPEDGGRLVSLALGGIELLGSERPTPGEPKGWFHGSFPMAPFAGRLTNGRFEFQDAEYRVPLNWNAHAGHGVVFDVPWRVESPQTLTRLRLRTDLDERWPLGGWVQQEFLLTESYLTMRLIVFNDQRAMPASVGFHPWFRRNVGTGGNASLTVTPRRRYVSDVHGGSPTLTADLGQRPWNDVLTDLDDSPVVSWPNGPMLRLASSSDIWVVFEQLPDAFCVEPVSAPPDSLGTPRRGIVSPGVPLEFWFTIAWAA